MALFSNSVKVKNFLNILPYIAILGSILFLLKITWMRWGDIIIDLGRQTYTPLELLRGKALYKEINYPPHGPLPVYLHTLLYKLITPHINILVACGISITFLTSLLLYRISRFFINPVLASFIPLTFIFVSAFGNYVYINNYNFILPYNYASTYGIFFSLVSIYLFIEFIYHNRLKQLIGMGIFISLTFLCKFEIGISLLIPISLSIFFLTQKKKIIIIASSLWIFTIFYSLFYLRMDVLPVLNKTFANSLMGVTGLRENIYLIIFCTISYVLILAYLLCFDYILYNLKDNISVKLAITFIAYFTVSIIIIIIKNYMNPYIQYRGLPIICILTACLSLKKSDIPILTISLFSLLLTARIILKVSAAHYGFYLIVPGLITYYLFFYNVIPNIYKRFTKNGLYYLSISVFFVLLILNHFNIYYPVYKNRTLRIETKRGVINYLNNTIGNRYKELIDHLVNNTSPNETLVALPEGIDINFFTGLRNPISYCSFLPSESAVSGREKEIISQIDKNKVDYIVILQRDTTEYGPASFGIDYGTELSNWVRENYEILKTFGPAPFTTPEFGIALMKKKK